MTHAPTQTRPPWTIRLAQPRRQRSVNAAANVYLSSAAEGLAWLHNCDKTGPWQRLELRDERRALFAQLIGCPGTSGQAVRP